MKSVEPIRNVDDIERIKDYLKEKNERDYLLFMFGIYSGIRISDYIILKVRDVKGERIGVIERKTKKTRTFPIHPKLKKAIKNYIEHRNLKEYDYLFPSRKRDRRNGVQITHIQRKTAWEIIRNAGHHIGLKGLGSHSMRKTFGYHYYNQTHDVVTLQKIFNHSSPTITLIYIGYQQDELDEAILSFDY
ncbi:site-specific integrase [Streptococcus sp. ZJ93]|uniref:site-specific integrase n=1 Tax=Streptococcus handemini TaxID=3161188 RepID=UPI0032EC839A